MDTIHHDNPKLSYSQPMLLLRNVAGKFTDISASAGPDLRVPRASRGAAIADFDSDGRLDVAVNNNDQGFMLLRNESAAGNWVALHLTGTKSNRDALGAVVKITDSRGGQQWQTLTTASSYLSASQKLVHFGLGKADGIREIEIRWPSGRMQAIRNAGINRVTTVREPQ
jgi:hypothetical protein